MFLTSGIKVYDSVQQDGKVIKSKTPFAIEVSITIIKIPTIEVETTIIKIPFTVGIGTTNKCSSYKANPQNSYK